MTREAKACGVDGMLAVTPYYNRPSSAGLSAHFRAMADLRRSSRDALRHPHSLGAPHRPPADHSSWPVTCANIVAVKDAAGDPARPRSSWRTVPTGFEVYCGDDSMTLPFASVGAVGVVSVAAHWAGPLFGEMINAHRSGQVDRATTINQQLAESYRFQSTDEFPNPVPAKAACRALGLPAGQCRLPNTRAPEALDDQARSVISRLHRMTPAPQSVA